MNPPLLPLTAFEELLFWENRPSYPCSCFARMQFSGRIDRAAFGSALEMVIPRHPLLASRVEARGRRLFWQRQTDALPEIRWLSGPRDGLLPAPYQDLQKEMGLRLFVAEENDSCEVIAQFHHACCDGLGIQTFGNDLIVAYALAKGVQSKRLKLPALDPDRLARRGAYGLSYWSLLKLIPAQFPGFEGALHFFARRPSPLLPHQPRLDDEKAPAGFPAALTHAFSREETVALRNAARRLNVTANDLLVRDLYIALDEWRTRHGAFADDDWLRVMIPMNLRAAQDRPLPAANVVGAVFLDRRRPEFADPSALLAGIAQELKIIRDRRLGLIFIYALHLLNLFPYGIRRITRQERCMVSAIFSNLGRPFLRSPLPRTDGQLVTADLVLQRLDGAVPFPPFDCVTATAIEYARRLSMTLHYDPRFVTAWQADDLSNVFARRVRATVAQNA